MNEKNNGWKINVEDVIDYENGDMDWDRLVDFFQNLINNGMAWTLQGHYGRMAKGLIDEGYCFMPEDNK